jgi:hypothetical protein
LAGSQLLLLKAEASGYLNIELVYRLRPKEPVVAFEDWVRATFESI